MQPPTGRGPQRDPTAATLTPAGSAGGYSAKRIALQEQAAVPVMPSLEAAQQLQASTASIVSCSIKRCTTSAVHLCQCKLYDTTVLIDSHLTWCLMMPIAVFSMI